MRSQLFYKAADPQGWDFRTHKTINYRESVGKIVKCPDQKSTPELCSASVIHASKKPNDVFIGANIPCSLYRVQGIPLVSDAKKSGFKDLKVLEEFPQEKLDEIFGWKYLESCNPINPLKLRTPTIGDAQIALLQNWDSVWDSVGASVRDSVGASVWDSVGASVWDSVGASVRDSVGASVRASVWASVRASVWASVGASVRDSVGASVWDSVWASVGASVWAYIGSLFPKIKTWNYAPKTKGYPYQPYVDLWRQGIVPSFDGTTWRLHTGEKATIVFEISAEKLRVWKP